MSTVVLIETHGWDFIKNWGEIKTKLKPFDAENFWEKSKKYEAENFRKWAESLEYFSLSYKVKVILVLGRNLRHFKEIL